MQSTSAAFKAAIKATDREVRGYLRFNGDNTKLLRGCDGLISIKHTAKLADRDRPMMGCANSMFCVVDFFNEGVTGISLANSFFDAYIGVVLEDTGTAPSGSIEPDTATVEYVFIGRFWISEVQRGDVATRVTAYDAFSKLNKEYVPTVTKGSDGYSVKDIFNDIITQCGLGFSPVTAGGIGYVDELYSGTCRQVAGWVINGGGAYDDPVNLIVSRNSEAGTFALRRIYRQWSFKDDADLLIDDSTVYLGGLDKGEDFTINSITSGTEENPVIVGNGTGIVGENPYMTETLATTFYNSVHGITFTPMTLEFRGNPAITVGDVMKVTTGGNTYYCYTQKITTVFNGGLKQTLECFGDSEYHYSMSTSPTQAQIRNVSTLVQEMQESIETADNGVITKILDQDGSWKELVIANNQDLSQATSVWRFNINGLEHSDAYSGGTVTLAFDTQGRIHANVIQTGILTDAAGKNSWNLDTGAFTITDGSIHINSGSDLTSRIEFEATNTPNNPGDFHLAIRPNGLFSSFTDTSNDIYYANLDTEGNWVEAGMTLSNGVRVDNKLRGDALLMQRYTSNPTTLTKMSELSHTYLYFYNGASNKYTTLLDPDSSGAGRIFLGDGTSNKKRTSLTNTGLEFADSNGTVTASYPADGTYLKSVNTAAANYTLSSSGYASVTKPAELTGKKIVSADVYSYTSATGAFSVSGYNSLSQKAYIFGTPGVTVTGLVIQFWYIGV